jgi:hypothetical protein
MESRARLEVLPGVPLVAGSFVGLREKVLGFSVQCLVFSVYGLGFRV